MANRIPAWFLIVTNYPGLHVGPTVPFLVGAIRDPVGEAPESRSTAQEELHSLLEKMRIGTPTGYGVRIQWCTTVDAFVVGLVSHGASLSWEPHELDASTIEGLFGKLWERYGDYICEGKYSKNGDWHRFSEQEIAAIRVEAISQIADIWLNTLGAVLDRSTLATARY